jgi:hypothetical protein
MMYSPKTEGQAAIYCRLSRDEDAGQESNSIGNQRRCLPNTRKKTAIPS